MHFTTRSAAALFAMTASLSVSLSSSARADDAGSQPTLVGDVQTCQNDAECATGHCVDGVCCDSACTSSCHSCALPSAPGRCTAVPAGEDPRGECGPAGSCAGTCGGAGTCTAASAGATCGKAACVGSTLTTASRCDASSACGVGATFECAPYACVAAVGACRSTCEGDTDCAAGFHCDLGSKSCVSGPHCSADGTQSIDAIGTAVDCAPYACHADGRCGVTCTSDTDCQSSYRCDTQTAQCGAPSQANGSSSGGGCATTREGAPAEAFGLAAFGCALFAIARRRRARR